MGIIHLLRTQSLIKVVLITSFHAETKNHKVFKGVLSGLRQVLATESPLKMMKNAFYFNLKLFWFSRYLFKFLSSLFGHVTERLDKKDKDNFNFMTSQPG